MVDPELFGPYRLDKLIGRGGMGEVYQAFDTRRDRVVALKRLPLALSADTEFVARFRREAATAARLQSPHVVPIHDYGDIDGRLFIDMRLVNGTDLGRLLADQGPLPPARAVTIIAQVASALDDAHAEKLVHRDVKPSNVLLTRDDFAYLADFGVARTLAGSTSLTVTGATVGTLAYMAPERFLGQPGDGLADIYALACVLYESLTGHPPFAGEELPGLMYAHVHLVPPLASEQRPGLPTDLDEVIARGMAKEPSKRFTNAAQLARAASDALHTSNSASTVTVPNNPSVGNRTTVRAESLSESLQDMVNADEAQGRIFLASPEPAPGLPRSRRRRPGLIAAVALTAGAGLVAGALALGHTGSTATRDPTVIATISGTSPFWVAVGPNGRHAYVTDSGAVSVIDTGTNTVSATIPVTEETSGVAVAPDGRRAYVASPRGTVSVIDTVSGPPIATIRVAGNMGTNTYGVAATPDGHHVYATNNGGGKVAVIDTTSNTVTATIPVGDTPVGVAVTPDGHRAYITNNHAGTVNAGTVSVIDTVSNTVTATLPVSGEPRDIAIAPNGRNAYITDEAGGAVLLMDTASNSVTATIPVGAQPMGVAVTRDGRHVYAANFGANTVSVIETASNTVTATISVGAKPLGIAVTPDGRRVYTTNRGSNTVSVIDTGEG